MDTGQSQELLVWSKKILNLKEYQPITFALGNTNFNAKLKIWKARIEKYNHELIYKPGKFNYVADLSQDKILMLPAVTFAIGVTARPHRDYPSSFYCHVKI